MEIIRTNEAPKAIGPYSQAIRTGNVLYTSGQVALDPATGNIVDGDFAAQVHRVFENLKAVLAAGGTGFNNVVKATVYLTDLANFTTLNEIYASYFGDTKPARTTVGVTQLPKEALVEIDLIAIV
jgi:2-iminobutanoate/2-iminopropanoate deaminase